MSRILALCAALFVAWAVLASWLAVLDAILGGRLQP